MSRVQRKSTVGQMKNNRQKYLIWATLALIAIGAIVAVAMSSRVPEAASTPTQGAAPLKIGQAAPDFSAATTQGPFTLSKDQDGKPVFLEVLATWCPHCQRETQVINQIYAKYKDKVHFVAVTGSNLGMDGSTPASQADLFAFGQRFKVQYPLAFDPDLTVAKNYLQDAFPTLVIIDKHGKIASVQTGEITPDALSAEINKTL